jgi:SAM-dependent methyltransferase
VKALLKSCLCSQAQLESPEFRQWAERLREPFRWHRKLWEHCYIAQALYERGMLEPGRRGLGFAVGREPLTALFASLGCQIVATDIDEASARRFGWSQTGQHANSLDALNERGICDPKLFRERTSFRVTDMRNIPADLGDFDFCWSACAFEHLGSIEHGKQFVRNMTRCLKPGGVAIHTTEYNVSSNADTRDHNEEYVLFRRQDIEDVAARLRSQGHRIDLDFTLATGEKDRYVDPEPFTKANAVVHLRLKIDPYVVTSIGLIIEIGRPRFPHTWWQTMGRLLRAPTASAAATR